MLLRALSCKAVLTACIGAFTSKALRQENQPRRHSERNNRRVIWRIHPFPHLVMKLNGRYIVIAVFFGDVSICVRNSVLYPVSTRRAFIRSNAQPQNTMLHCVIFTFSNVRTWIYNISVIRQSSVLNASVIASSMRTIYKADGWTNCCRKAGRCKSVV